MEQRARRRKPGSAWREASLAEGVGVVGVGIGIVAAGERPSSPAAIGAAIGVVAAIGAVAVAVAAMAA